MKRIFKKIGIIFGIALGSIIGLVLVALAGLNVAKFIIYDEYYDIEESVCKNPGLRDGFVCQGICATENEIPLRRSFSVKRRRLLSA